MRIREENKDNVDKCTELTLKDQEADFKKAGEDYEGANKCFDKHFKGDEFKDC